MPRVVKSATEYPRRRWWHRWDVVCDAGWISGHCTRRRAALDAVARFRYVPPDGLDGWSGLDEDTQEIVRYPSGPGADHPDG